MQLVTRLVAFPRAPVSEHHAGASVVSSDADLVQMLKQRNRVLAGEASERLETAYIEAFTATLTEL
jgi:hypothetical protein